MKLRLIALAVVAIASCKRSAPPPPPEVDPKQITWPERTPDAGVGSGSAATPVCKTDQAVEIRKELTGASKTFMVAAESIEASTAGRDVLAAGGNAVDAAVATALALAVTHPTAGNLGGGGFAVVRTAPGKAMALDFRETAPGAATDTMYLDKDGKPTDDSRIGHRASGVPGAVAGLYELHKKLGKKPWKDLVEPAIKLARDGFPIDDYLAKAIARKPTADKLAKSPASAALWLPDGKPVEVGAVVKIPELAKTLERIRDQGPDGFYKGETAAAIVAEMKAGGGIITAEDLAGYKAVWREPLRFTYRGRSVTSMPPPSSGGVVIAMVAGMLGGLDLGKIQYHGPDHIHRLAEVWRRAYWIRNDKLADPAFFKEMPLAQLMSAEYQQKLAATIGPKATLSKAVPPLIEGLHTTNLCVVDGKGMAVALTTTINTSFGSGVTIPGAGFVMNNEMDDFTAKPGSPNMFGFRQGAANKIEPGKRMLSSMSPTIVEDAQGELVLVVGAEGGSRIITAVFQTMSNVIDFGMPVARAVAEPRIHQQDFPDVLQLQDASIDQPTEGKLRDMGHELKWGLAPQEFGGVSAIARTKDGWEGSVDPRRRGAALDD